MHNHQAQRPSADDHEDRTLNSPGGPGEFMEGVTAPFDPKDLPGMSRKQFLALVAASAAFAASGCTAYKDKGEIVPYTRKPEEITPGLADLYASTCTGCAQACGILVKTREGRPIKIDGNPEHPVNRGGLCARGQASIMGLYDPARMRAPEHGAASGRSGVTTWTSADNTIVAHLQECVKAGREIAIISPPVTSPGTASVLAAFTQAYPGTRVYSYALNNDLSRTRAWKRCYGDAPMPAIRWEDARLVLALEGDFLGTDGVVMEQIRGYAAARDVKRGKDIARLYCVEGNLSLTGTNADYRLRLRPDLHVAFLSALLREIAGRLTIPNRPAASLTIPAGPSLAELAASHGLDRAVLAHLVDDLLEHRGRTVIFGGSTLPDDAHVLVFALTQVLGNNALYRPDVAADLHVPLSTEAELNDLVGRMRAGDVGAVIHAGANPVFHFPPATGYEEALRKVPLSVSMTELEDETARLCTYVLPAHTMLESWGDHEVRRGIFSLQQPVVAPLYDSRQREAALLHWAGSQTQFSETTYLDHLKKRWEREVYPAAGKPAAVFQAFWQSALHDGVQVNPATREEPLRFRPAALETVKLAPTGGAFVVSVTESLYTGDGQFANNGWLQELPHPVSKVVWDNYAAVSPASAAGLGVHDGDMIELGFPHGSQKFPVFVQAGQADGHVGLTLGYGRWNAGPVGTGVGTSVSGILPAQRFLSERMLTGASVARVPGTHPLVTTQEHHPLDDPFVKDFHLKRKIIREGTVAQYLADPEFLHHEKIDLFSIATEVEYKGVKWAMAIDLNKCIGCNACVASCNVENNIPVIGKDQVAAGREMQWLRIDRYFAGTPEAPIPSHQPMLCQHCDQAPCENVCPVVATNHSPDGLNQMVYNRCVGTKYCSNNCPYKVRRFNFFNFRDHFADGYYDNATAGLMNNPEVTVRSRGVMEKCTFCVQRISEARQHAAEQGRPLAGSDVRTACQEACPATAIVFGDMNDPASEVSQARAHHLGYHVLEETNARPNVTYLARLRNLHSEKSA